MRQPTARASTLVVILLCLIATFGSPALGQADEGMSEIQRMREEEAKKRFAERKAVAVPDAEDFEDPDPDADAAPSETPSGADGSDSEPAAPAAPPELDVFETDLGALSRVDLPMAQGEELMTVRISADQAAVLPSELDVAPIRLEESIRITLLFHPATGQWLATDGRVATYEGKPHLVEGQQIRLLGAKGSPISLAGTRVSSGFVRIHDGAPIKQDQFIENLDPNAGAGAKRVVAIGGFVGVVVIVLIAAIILAVASPSRKRRRPPPTRAA